MEVLKMNKIKLTALLLSIALIAAVLPVSAADVSAVPSKQIFYLDGTKVELAAYNINGNNYVKLRDVCKLLDYGLSTGSGRGKELIVYLSSTAGYSGAADANDGIMPTGNTSAVPSEVYGFFDGIAVQVYTNPLGQIVPDKQILITAYNINGNNYVQLRSLAEKLKQFGAKDNGFDVRFDSGSNGVNIYSKTAYTGTDISTNPPAINLADETVPEPAPDDGRKDNYNYKELPDEDEIRELALEVVRLTNEERAKEGLPPLEVNEELMTAAQTKSQDMADNDYFSHDSPTWGGSTWMIIPGYGDYITYVGENIVGLQQFWIYNRLSNPDDAVLMWMQSKGHKANILNDGYNSIGVGVAYVKGDRGEYNQAYYTQVFGKVKK
jgi:uncharacterized protein YkwD